MKKYLITGGVGLVAVAIIGWMMLRTGFGGGLPTAEGELFELLPARFDQLLYFSFDDELRAAMSQMAIDQESVGFQQLATTVDELVVMQQTDEVTPISLMFFVSDTPVDIASLQAQGVIAGDASYVTKKLASNIWMYGDANSIQGYDLTQGNASSVEGFSDWVNTVHAGDYNVGMFSLSQLVGTVSPIASQFAQALRWTAVVSHLDGKRAHGEVIMQFAAGIVPDSLEKFTPELDSYRPAGAVAYLEITNLLDLFGIGADQFGAVASIFFGQLGGGVYSALLSSGDYATLYEGLNNHLALNIAPASGGLLALGGTIIIADADIFDLFRKLGPMWKELIGGTSGAAQVEEYASDDLLRRTSSENPLSLLGQTLEVHRDEQTTQVKLGTLVDEGYMSGENTLSYTDKSIATFVIDTNQLQQAIATAQGLPTGVEQLDTSGYLQGGVVRGHLQAIPANNQLSLSFNVE